MPARNTDLTATAFTRSLRFRQRLRENLAVSRSHSARFAADPDVESDDEEKEYFSDGDPVEQRVPGLGDQLRRWKYKGSVRMGGQPNGLGQASVALYLRRRAPYIRRRLLIQLRNSGIIKFILTLIIYMVKPGVNDNNPEEKVFNSHTVALPNANDVGAALVTAMDWIESGFDEFVQNGSGWVLLNIKQAILEVREITPSDAFVGGHASVLNIGRGGSYIPAVWWLEGLNSILNPDNSNEECLRYCLELAKELKDTGDCWNRRKNGSTRGTQRFKHSHIQDDYPLSQSPFNFDGISWPPSGTDVDLIEKRNAKAHRIAINIIEPTFTPGQWIMVRRSPKADESSYLKIWLVLIRPVITVKGKTSFAPYDKGYHFALIKPNKLKTVLSPYSIKNRSTVRMSEEHQELIRKMKRGIQYDYVCERCLYSTKNEALFSHHKSLKLCHQRQETTTRLPYHRDARLYDKSFDKREPCEYVIMADTECLLIPPEKSKNKLHTHVPYQFGFLVKSLYDDWSEYRTISIKPDDDVNAKSSRLAQQFIEELLDIQNRCIERSKEHLYIDPVLTQEQRQQFDVATHCHICNLPFEGNIHHPLFDEMERRQQEKLRLKKKQNQERVAKREQEKKDIYQQWKDNDEDDDIFNAKQLELLMEYQADIDIEDSIPDESVSTYEINQRKVIDHNHRLPPKQHYRGAAHSICNLQCRNGWNTDYKTGKSRPTRSWKIPVFFHNFKKYDANLVLRNIGQAVFDMMKENKHYGDITVIPQQGDAVMSFSIGHLQFVDSISFLGESLDKTVQSMKIHMNDPISIRRVFPDLVKAFSKELHRGNGLPHVEPEDPRFKLLLQKGASPYEFMTDASKLQYPRLPDKKDFFSILNGEGISDQQYSYAQRVWNEFECKTLEDYQNIYLAQDVLLLTARMMIMREVCRKNYHLDPFKYISSPALAKDAMLVKQPIVKDKYGYSAFEVSLFPADDDGVFCYEYCEKMIRGGITSVPNRSAYAKEDNNTKVEIAYIDATNLYGWAQSQPLPIGEYKVWNPSQVSALPIEGQELHEKLNEMALNDKKGYFITLDIHLPSSLHDWFSDYPLYPIPRTVEYAETSPYYHHMMESIYDHEEFRKSGKKVPMFNHDDKTGKLILDLKDKKSYQCSLPMIILGMRLGYKFSNVTTVIQFKQQPWIKSFIDTNAKLRKESTDPSEKDFFKLLSNSGYGKLIQNDRKHMDCIPVTNEEKLRKILRNPFVENIQIIRDDSETEDGILAFAFRRKRIVKLNKPIAAGVMVLEWSKYHMFSTYYEKIKPVFGSDVKMLMTDTDSMILQFTHHKMTDKYLTWQEKLIAAGHADILNMSKSVYEKDIPAVKLMKDMGLDREVRDGVVGVFKDEYPYPPIDGFVGLKAKMYSVRTHDPETNETKASSKAKGVKRSIVKGMTFEQYEQCLFGDEEYEVARVNMVGIHVKNRVPQTDVTHKQTLSQLDSKRFMLNATETLPYGHYRIADILTQSNVEQTPKRIKQS